MNKKEETPAHTRSWRTLKQTGKNRAVTFQAKKKRLQDMAIYSLYIALVVSIVTLGGIGVYLYKSNPSFFYAGGSSDSVKHINFKTDGVLTQQWVESKLGIGKDVGLMTLDIHALDLKLESEGQVESATIKRSFPDTLIVSIKERIPAFKLMAGEGVNATELIVSRDGTIYKGSNYSAQVLQQLLWITGVNIKRTDNGYSSLECIPLATELVDVARKEMPSLVSNWISVDCRDFDGRANVAWALIRVKTHSIGEIAFVPRDFSQQLVRLDSILSSMDVANYSQIKKIDLSLSDHSTVKLADSGIQKKTALNR
jgi:cell division septal protein FtsQ